MSAGALRDSPSRRWRPAAACYSTFRMDAECIVAQVEHKGFRYSVVQTANPRGWRWTVELDPPRRSRTGESLSRTEGLRKALSVIDKLTSHNDQKKKCFTGHLDEPADR